MKRREQGEAARGFTTETQLELEREKMEFETRATEVVDPGPPFFCGFTACAPSLVTICATGCSRVCRWEEPPSAPGRRLARFLSIGESLHGDSGPHGV